MQLNALARLALLTCGLASIASSAAEEPRPRNAEPDAAAKERGRGPAQPPPFASSKGFGTTLEPYRGVMADADVRLFHKHSEELLTSPLGDAVKAAVALVAEQRKKENELYQSAKQPDVLFTYEIPNDPSLRLGLAKSRDGKVTAPPRLLSGVLELKPPKKAGPVAPEAELGDMWFLPAPEQACTQNLAYSLTPTGSALFAFEYLPPAAELDGNLIGVLTDIENYPNPILKGEAGMRAAGVDLSQGETAGGPKAAGKSEADRASESDLQEIIAEMEAASGKPGVALLPERKDELFAKIDAGGEVPFATFAAAQIAQGDAPHMPTPLVLKALLAIAPRLPDLKKRCVQAGRKWSEVRRVDGDALSLFGCFLKDGKHQAGLGARAFTAGGRYIYGFSFFNEDPAADLGVELHLDLESAAVTLASYKNEDYFGPRLVYELSGEASALDFQVPEARRGSWGEYDVFEWHANGAIKLVGRRKGGQPAGEERSYYESGTLAGVVRYDDRGLVTSYREWFENQRPAEDTSFREGEMHGVRRWWHPNGRQAGELSYSGGVPDGKLVLWYDGGAPGVTATYRRGALDGDVRWSYEDSGPLFVGHYAGDVPHGIQRLSLPTGVVISERSFKNGDPDGTWTSFDAQGKALRELAFRGGAKDGRTQLRYPSGQIALDITWKTGEVDGTVSSYYPEGQLAATCVYDQDQLVQFTRLAKTGETQLEGKVTDAIKGTGGFVAMRKDGSKSIECTLAAFEIEGCKLFAAGGEEVPLPAYAELTRRIQTVEPPPAAAGLPLPVKRALSWRPERCGGYTAHYNYDSIINGTSEAMFVSFDAKQECTDPTLGQNLLCTVDLEGGRSRPQPCIVSGYEGGTDPETVVEERDDPAGPEAKLAH